MQHLPSYTKVLAIGHRVLARLWDGPVELTEKVDGSQFRFGKVDGDLRYATKRVPLWDVGTDKMFLPGVKQVRVAANEIPDGILFVGETLCRPKHNVLEYDRVPEGHVALFAGMDMASKEMLHRQQLEAYADAFGMDIVPILYKGDVSDVQQVIDLLHTKSFLGGPNIEGVVAKNYAHDALIGDVYYPYLVGKYVSEKFKEKHDKDWGKRKSVNKWEAFKDSFRTEARWRKGVQHLREAGALLGEPKDIGPLMKEIQIDLEDEHKEEIMEWLYKTYRKELLGRATQGLPEWYKEQLAKGEING